MTRKCHNHTLQTKPRHCAEGEKRLQRYNIPKKIKKNKVCPSGMTIKQEGTQSTTQQNKTTPL